MAALKSELSESVDALARQVEGAAKEKEEDVDALTRVQAAHDAASTRIEELLVCVACCLCYGCVSTIACTATGSSWLGGYCCRWGLV